MSRKNPLKSLTELLKVVFLSATIALFSTAAIGIGPYTDNGDTVTDNATGLDWQKSDDSLTYNWAESLQYCENLVLDGSGAWRLPNKRELDSIVDLSSSNPAIDIVFSCQIGEYWSSTTYDLDPARAWSTDFQYGHDDFSLKSDQYYVRCVRGTELGGGGMAVGGTANVPVQNGFWLLGTLAAGIFLLWRLNRKSA